MLENFFLHFLALLTFMATLSCNDLHYSLMLLTHLYSDINKLIVQVLSEVHTTSDPC